MAINRVVGLGKCLKNAGQGIGGDPDAIVGDGDDDLVIFISTLDTDGPVKWRELGGVFEQVPKDLLEARKIAADRKLSRL